VELAQSGERDKLPVPARALTLDPWTFHPLIPLLYR
jgi:hypothetical protein